VWKHFPGLAANAGPTLIASITIIRATTVNNTRMRLTIFHLLSLFSKTKPVHLFNSEEVAGCATGSARLLSAHLCENELLSLYLGFRLCSLADSIMSVAVAVRVCQVAYTCSYLGATSGLLCA
jgi:hypothetical protein